MENTTFTPLLDVAAELTERCDRCGAAAKLTVAMAEGELAFCGHHANAHAGSITRIAARVRVLADFAWAGGAPLSTVDSEPARAPRAYRNSR